MLEEFQERNKSKNVYRVASVADATPEERLLRRGINPAVIEPAIQALAGVSAVHKAEQIAKDSFVPKSGYPTPFRPGRFGDGTIPVFYSAVEDSTAIQELLHRIKESMIIDRISRHYTIFICAYSGETKILIGREKEFPELVSQGNEGYPFCQRLGKEAHNSALIDGFFTPSTRQSGGTCVPIFKERAISNFRIHYLGTFIVEDDQITFQPN